MFNEYNDLMTVQEVAEVLHCGKNMVYTLLKSDELKAFRLGYRWKIPKQSLEEYILSQSHLTT